MKTILFIPLLVIALSAAGQLKFIPSGTYHWSDFPVKKGEKRETRSIMTGSSAQMEYLQMHATTQQKGAIPNAPHAAKDEEVIFVTEGVMKCTVGDKSKVLGKNSFILIPPLEMQSIVNIGDGPLTYYVMTFRSKKPVDIARSAKAGGSLLLNADSLKYVPSARGGGVKYLDRPTAMCENFEMHITELKSKGPSHAPHSHEDTEAILVINGDTDMLIGDKTYHASAGDLYLMNSGELHGISNAADAPCKYFAIRWR